MVMVDSPPYECVVRNKQLPSKPNSLGPCTNMHTTAKTHEFLQRCTVVLSDLSTDTELRKNKINKTLFMST